MNRYLLFAGNDYYPSGGALDLLHVFDTLREAKQYVALWGDRLRIRQEPMLGVEAPRETVDWAHIYDVEQRRYVWFLVDSAARNWIDSLTGLTQMEAIDVVFREFDTFVPAMVAGCMCGMVGNDAVSLEVAIAALTATAPNASLRARFGRPQLYLDVFHRIAADRGEDKAREVLRGLE